MNRSLLAPFPPKTSPVTAIRSPCLKRTADSKTYMLSLGPRVCCAEGSTANETIFGAVATITASNPAGADFMIFGIGQTNVSASEPAVNANFFDAGKSLFLFDERAAFVDLNDTVNSFLSAAGTPMSLTAENFGDCSVTTFSVTGSPPAAANSWNTWTTASPLAPASVVALP